MSEASTESEAESDRRSEDESGSDSEESEESKESEDEDNDSNEADDVEEDSASIPLIATIKETIDTMMMLSSRMDASRGRLRGRFPPGIAPPTTPQKNVIEPQPNELSREEALSSVSVNLVAPYHNTPHDDELTGVWAGAPHVAAALRTLLLDD
mmetsp:Transcript_66630/g.134319  ORF Transcript_66630/g.134319 Transcript_66630/m.134319 type:complete len:154 (+) Transcript_66630:62-523(+)